MRILEDVSNQIKDSVIQHLTVRLALLILTGVPHAKKILNIQSWISQKENV